MTFYCLDHPDFEGLDQGKLHDHIEQDHPEVKDKEGYKQFFQEKIEVSEFRRSDRKMIARSWGRVPKVGNFMGDNQKEK